MENVKDCLSKLKAKGFKLTPQRLAVIEHLEGNSSHPSASDLFEEVKKKYPMISFATVYNTLRILGEVQEIKQLTIGSDKVNFDPNTEQHDHFFCRECGKIMDVFRKDNPEVKEINGHCVHECQIYFYGICSECLKASQKEE
ncbi:MAG: transcriptional repressor [Candidatus Aminicenantes bacterium]|nr:transcriptional repressor [Candidatus Aminicenantes bacterium]